MGFKQAKRSGLLKNKKFLVGKHKLETHKLSNSQSQVLKKLTNHKKQIIDLMINKQDYEFNLKANYNL